MQLVVDVIKKIFDSLYLPILNLYSIPLTKMADAGNIEADKSSSYYCKKILQILAWVIKNRFIF